MAEPWSPKTKIKCRLCVFSCTAESSFAPLFFSPASTLFFPGGRRQKLPVRFCSVLRHFRTFSTFIIKTSFELVLSWKTANKTFICFEVNVVRAPFVALQCAEQRAGQGGAARLVSLPFAADVAGGVLESPLGTGRCVLS